LAAIAPLPHDDRGSGPALILLHAGIADRRMWREHLVPLAAEDFRVLAVDMPGFGEAPVDVRPPWEVVLETMDALAIERAVLIGSSFGGAVALSLAAVAPRRVAGLLTLSAPSDLIEPSPELMRVWEAEDAALELGDVNVAVAAVLDSWLLPERSEALAARVEEMQRRTFELREGAEGEEWTDPLSEDLDVLGELNGPAILAAGEHDMSDFHAAAEVLAVAIPGARKVVIEGAGHLAPLETPEAFLVLARELLADVRG
jgi:pimeloyl-ACP methyl ester carboxylesterase